MARTAATRSVYQQTVIKDRPMLYWTLGDGTKTTGATVSDSSGNGNTGVYGSTITSGTSALNGDSDTSATLAQTFTGNTGSSRIANTVPFMTPGTTRTIELWCYRSSMGAATNPIAMAFTQGCNPTSGNTGMYCFWGGSFSTNPQDVVFAPNGNAGTTHNFAGVLPAGPNGNATQVWVHMVIIWIDSSQSAILYINGVFKGFTTGLGSPGASDQGGVALGAWQASSNNFYYAWTGSLDEFAIYPYILTGAQIADHYRAGIGVIGRSPYRQMIVADRPDVYWRMGEANTTAPVDYSGSSPEYNLILNGGYSTGQTGLINDSDGCILFNGTTGYGVGNVVRNANTKAFSFECWCYLTATPSGSGKYMVSDQLTTTGRYLYTLTGTGTVFGFYSTAFGNYTGAIAPVLSTGVRHHVVGTFDGDKTLVLYIDNVATTQTYLVTLAVNPSSVPLGVGNYGNGASNFFPGYIDEVAYYNYCLSAAQVSAHYNMGLNNVISRTAASGRVVVT